jgi:hypothetical protein
MVVEAKRRKAARRKALCEMAVGAVRAHGLVTQRIAKHDAHALRRRTLGWMVKAEERTGRRTDDERRWADRAHLLNEQTFHHYRARMLA